MAKTRKLKKIPYGEKLKHDEKAKGKNLVGKVGKRNWIAALVLFVLILCVNMINTFMADQSVIHSVCLSLGNTLDLLSYVVLMYFPVLSLVFILGSQASLILNDIVAGKSFSEAMTNNGVIEVYCWMIMLALIVRFYKTFIENDDTWKKQGMGKKITDLIHYRRDVAVVPLWAAFIVWTLAFTVLFMTATEETIDIASQGSTIKRVYFAAAVALPTLTALVRYTTTNITYQFMLVTIVLRMITAGLLIKQGQLTVDYLLFFIIQLFIYVVVLVNYIKYRNKNK